MIDKNQEIDNLKEIQATLKSEIVSLKAKRPTFLIGFLFFMVLVIFILESRVYHFFGNGMNFIQFGIGLYILISVIYLLINKNKVSKKENRLKTLSGKLYQLMKLDNTDKNV